MNFKSNGYSLKLLTPGADPYLNRCVNYAIAAELILHKPTQSGFRVQISDKGKAFYKALVKEKLVEDILAIAKTVGIVSGTEIETALKAGKR